MTVFAIRNLKVYFKDKTSVFFSLLAVFIIIGLYALFLGDVIVKSVEDLSGARYLIDSWMTAGLLAVTSFTTTMGAFGTMIDDKVKKIRKDFIVSPAKTSDLAGGYILSAFIIGIIMSLLTLILAEIYIISFGGELLGISALLKTFGLILLSTMSNTSIVLFIVSFLNSSNAFATANTITGTMIGFITGIYIPVGNLPDAVQWVVKCFPPSHAAVLLRQVMMSAPMEASFKGAPAQVQEEFKELMGVTFKFGDATVTPYVSIAILLITTAVFFALSVVNLSRKTK